MFKRILIATDGSDHSRRAVAVGAEMAKCFAAELHLLHVVPPGPIEPALMHMAEVEHLEDGPDPGHRRLRHSLGERLLEDAEAAARKAGAPNCHCHMEEGDAVACVVDAVQRLQADLLVMGSRGLSDFKGLLLGSVSHKVCQLAPCTCTTVK